ncbi:MAG TPA: hypothetical protein VFB12_16730 [Ktedonobacteraceae bacterium]|nr:hypothetical protein [Ktedonobacteraceae bacterium]
MYMLDFETIQQVMQAYQQTGRLSADVPSGVAGLREPCHVEINVIAGLITSCTVVGKSGQKVTGKKAEQELVRLGQLRWTFTPQSETVLQPSSPVLTKVSPSFFPRRSAQVEQRQMRHWSRLHRATFALADGTRNVEKIAAILSTSSDQLAHALHELQSMGVIVMEPPDVKKR